MPRRNGHSGADWRTRKQRKRRGQNRESRAALDQEAGRPMRRDVFGKLIYKRPKKPKENLGDTE